MRLTFPLTRRNIQNLTLMAVSTLWPPNAMVLGRNTLDINRSRRSKTVPVDDEGSLQDLIDDALAWLIRAQDHSGSGGIACFRFYGWTRGYPEVTGYAIPTFWDCYHMLDRKELAERAIRMADWEISRQKKEGGFESLYEGDGQPPVVFNTGQVIRGLVRTYRETGSEHYLDAGVRAGNWIVANQESDGSWTRANYLGMKRTYDVYVAAALAQLSQTTSDVRYADAAARNCEFAVAHQRENGWFEFCDNTPYSNHAPITHTICYTIDGLLETGELMGKEAFVDAGCLAAHQLMAHVEPTGRLWGRFDENWKPRARYVVLTGSAQLGVILAKLYFRTGDPAYLDASRRLACFLAHVQKLNAIGANRRGAMAGSYPVWGRYVPLKFPSWATKFFLDHLLLLQAAVKGTSSPVVSDAV